jgi:hypothetical protein
LRGFAKFLQSLILIGGPRQLPWSNIGKVCVFFGWLFISCNSYQLDLHSETRVAFARRGMNIELAWIYKLNTWVFTIECGVVNIVQYVLSMWFYGVSF